MDWNQNSELILIDGRAHIDLKALEKLIFR